MAPGYRNSNRRQNRLGLADHDVFAGIPVRQWRRDLVTVTSSTSQENNAGQNDIWAVELPYGMPKDSHLLPQHSQDLLRAARSGKIYSRPNIVEEDEPDPDTVTGDKTDKKDEIPKNCGFVARAWRQIPRHLEGPEIEFLAERRKGLKIPNDHSAAPTGPRLTKTTVKRVDAAGNEYIQDVVVPQGQKIEGEIISQTIITDQSAIVDAYSTQPTPPKRRGPFRKKFKPLGRPRKKKPLAIIRGAASESMTPVNSSAYDSVPPNNEDTEMGDELLLNSDDGEGYEGEDVEENEEDEGTPNNQSSPKKNTGGEPNFQTLPFTEPNPYSKALNATTHTSDSQVEGVTPEIDKPKTQSDDATSVSLMISHISDANSSKSEILTENIHTTERLRTENCIQEQKYLLQVTSEAVPLQQKELFFVENQPAGANEQDREILLDINSSTSLPSGQIIQVPTLTFQDQSEVPVDLKLEQQPSNNTEDNVVITEPITQSTEGDIDGFPILLG